MGRTGIGKQPVVTALRTVDDRLAGDTICDTTGTIARQAWVRLAKNTGRTDLPRRDFNQKRSRLALAAVASEITG